MPEFGERRGPLLTILDTVYVDTVKEKAIVGIHPKPAFLLMFKVATAGKGRAVVWALGFPSP